MKLFNGLHHIAIICSDYHISKQFYTSILGFEILQEVYRKEKESYKLDLCLDGLRHIAFKVNNIRDAIKYLQSNNINVEYIRIDEYTGKQFTFFRDPDNLPIELYETTTN